MVQHYFDLTGKIAIITGGSKGLGEQMAHALAEAGADLALVSRTQVDLDNVAAEVHAATGRRVIGVAADVTKEADISIMVQKVMAEFGKIDILINNAGIGGTTPILDLQEAEWDRYMDLNLKGPVLCAKHVGAEMIKCNQGNIINVSSLFSKIVARYMAAYAATKTALVSFTRTLALEWARYNIRVNALCPGYFETPMNAGFWQTKGGRGIIERIPMQRVGDPKEIKTAIIFLASDANTFMTGSTLFVDGGHSLVG
ncbi:MAG TPA: glucose 1-dehydrogenase [Candidatus Binatia bacterium]|nr:glucose 1-dehydrogenase [Candidatus Binatia bacterium]